MSKPQCRLSASLVTWITFAVMTMGTMGVSSASQPAPSKQQAWFEIHFLTGMIDHHAMAVMMGEMCVDEAVPTDLRDLCADIASSQTAEIDQMLTWLSTWYDVAHEPDPSGGGMKKLSKLDGAQFAIVFMETMIRHHASAIDEATECLRRAHHPTLRDMCADIVEVQSEEIDLMRTWLCDWYGRCGPV